jgi:hypothetical protein
LRAPYTPGFVMNFPTRKNSRAHFKIQNLITAAAQKLKTSIWF